MFPSFNKNKKNSIYYQMSSRLVFLIVSPVHLQSIALSAMFSASMRVPKL